MFSFGYMGSRDSGLYVCKTRTLKTKSSPRAWSQSLSFQEFLWQKSLHPISAMQSPEHRDINWQKKKKASSLKCAKGCIYWLSLIGFTFWCGHSADNCHHHLPSNCRRLANTFLSGESQNPQALRKVGTLLPPSFYNQEREIRWHASGQPSDQPPGKIQTQAKFWGKVMGGC